MFTEEDALDDAKIKKEVQSDLIRVAKGSETIYQHFENVCNQVNQDPKRVLADMLVRSLNDQEYADTILNTDVTMDSLNQGEYRKGDIEFVKEIAEEFDLEPDDSENLIERIIDKRIESVSTSPFDRVNDSDKSKDRKYKKLEREVEMLRRELDKERSKNETSDAEDNKGNESESSVVVRDEGDDEKKSIDELFDDKEEDETVTDVEVDNVESEEDGEDDEGVESVVEEIDDDSVEDSEDEDSGEFYADVAVPIEDEEVEENGEEVEKDEQ